MKQYDAPPAMQIDPAKTYRATISTNQGIRLLSETIYPFQRLRKQLS